MGEAVPVHRAGGTLRHVGGTQNLNLENRGGEEVLLKSEACCPRRSRFPAASSPSTHTGVGPAFSSGPSFCYQPSGAPTLPPNGWRGTSSSVTRLASGCSIEKVRTMRSRSPSPWSAFWLKSDQAGWIPFCEPARWRPPKLARWTCLAGWDSGARCRPTCIVRRGLATSPGMMSRSPGRWGSPARVGLGATR